MSTINKKHKSRGFTLLELILCIVLVSIFAVVGNEVIFDSFYLANSSNSDNKSYAESRYAMQRMASEIREINFPSVAMGSCVANQYCISTPVTFPAPPTTYSITPANSFVFHKGPASDSVSMNLVNATTLQLNSLPLLNNVSAINFTFYDSNLSNIAPTKSNLRYVVIVMTVTPPNAQSFTLRTRVALRNFG